MGDHWGDLCATSELASTWADQLLPTQRSVLRDRQSGTYAFFSGTTLCYSALFKAGRHDELLELSNLAATDNRLIGPSRVTPWANLRGRNVPGARHSAPRMRARPHGSSLRTRLRGLPSTPSASAPPEKEGKRGTAWCPNPGPKAGPFRQS